MKWVANSNCVLGTDDPSITAVLVITSPPSTKSKAVGSGIYVDGDIVSASAVTQGTYVGAGPFTADMVSGSLKGKSEGSLVLLEGDESETISATLTNTVSPFDPTDVTFKAVIRSAGQNKVRSN